MIDELLKRAGLKYEDLNDAERQTLNEWMGALGKNELTLNGVRAYLASMRDSVEHDLAKSDNNTKNDLFLKARLRNYMLLEAFLTGPEKAKEALQKAMAGLTLKK